MQFFSEIFGLITGHLSYPRAIGSIGNEFAASISFSLSPPNPLGPQNIGFSNKDPVGTRDDGRQTHPNSQPPFRARVVNNVEINARQALTFLTVSRPKCATVLRFWNTDVRKTKQNNDFKNENARSPYVFDGSKNENARSPCVFNDLQPKITISLRSGAIFEPKRGEGTGTDATRPRRFKSVCNPSKRNLTRLALTHSFASHARTKRNDFPVRGPTNAGNTPQPPIYSQVGRQVGR